MGLLIRLRRRDTSTPWGFRMNGGVEFNQPLFIQRVSKPFILLILSESERTRFVMLLSSSPKACISLIRRAYIAKKIFWVFRNMGCKVPHGQMEIIF